MFDDIDEFYRVKILAAYVGYGGIIISYISGMALICLSDAKKVIKVILVCLILAGVGATVKAYLMVENAMQQYREKNGYE